MGAVDDPAHARFLADYRAHIRGWQQRQRARIEKARRSGGPIPAFSMQPPVGKFVRRAEREANERAGTDAAIPFLVWIVANAGRGEQAAGRRALTTLMESHLESPRLDLLAAVLPGAAGRLGIDAREYLGRILEENPSAAVRAAALHARSHAVVRRADVTSPEYASARKDLERVIELVPRTSLAARARAAIDLREKLAVGLPAPEIEGKDLDGVPFKLSDYRGKAILLSFWGDW